MKFPTWFVGQIGLISDVPHWRKEMNHDKTWARSAVCFLVVRLLANATLKEQRKVIQDKEKESNGKWKMCTDTWHEHVNWCLTSDLRLVLTFGLVVTQWKRRLVKEFQSKATFWGIFPWCTVWPKHFLFIYLFLELHILEALISSPSSRSSESAERLTPLHSVWNQSKISAVVAHFGGQLIPSVQSAGFW